MMDLRLHGRDGPWASDHVARSGQGSETAAGGERVLALVLDGEHDVIACAFKGHPALILHFRGSMRDYGL
jgi:hypothetical protein